MPFAPSSFLFLGSPSSDALSSPSSVLKDTGRDLSASFFRPKQREPGAAAPQWSRAAPERPFRVPAEQCPRRGFRSKKDSVSFGECFWVQNKQEGQGVKLLFIWVLNITLFLFVSITI